MRRKKIRKKYIKKQKKLIVLGSFVLFFFLAACYATFSTNINLSAKGNVYNKGNLCYTTSDNGDGTVTITDYDKACGSEVNIPSKIKGKTVTKIGDTAWNVSKVFNHKGLTKVVIPDTVTFIGDWAFWNNNISSLDLGNGVQTINQGAFGTNNITSIYFPKSLKFLGYNAFYSNNLTSIPSLENIEYEAGAFSCNNLTGNDVFVYSKNSDGVIDNTILNSYGGKWAYDITVPSSVKTIQRYAFRGTSANVLNLNNVETIEYKALFQLYIPTINISSSVKSIDAEAVYESPNIKYINIDRKEGSIEGARFGASGATVNWTGNN